MKYKTYLAPVRPNLGSGTTAEEALRYSRNFIGIELNPAYAKMVEKRIAAELAQLKLGVA